MGLPCGYLRLCYGKPPSLIGTSTANIWPCSKATPEIIPKWFQIVWKVVETANRILKVVACHPRNCKTFNDYSHELG